MTRSDWVARPEHSIDYLRDVRKVPASRLRIPARLVLVFGGQDLRMFRRMLKAETLEWFPWLCVGRAGDHPVAVNRTTIGAPAAVISLEERIAQGARRIIMFGSCGSLVEDLHIGEAFLPTFAHSDEGTSRHYGGGRRSLPDRAMTAALREAFRRRDFPLREGGVWTTDAPYREARSRVRALAARGVLAVDMESSAIFTVARHRGARAAGLFVVSDELGGPGWNQGWDDPRFLAGKRKAAKVLVDALARGSA